MKELFLSFDDRPIHPSSSKSAFPPGLEIDLESSRQNGRMIAAIHPGRDILYAWSELEPRRKRNVVESLHSQLIVENVSQNRLVFKIVRFEHGEEAQAVSIVLAARDNAAAAQACAGKRSRDSDPPASSGSGRTRRCLQAPCQIEHCEWLPPWMPSA